MPAAVGRPGVRPAAGPRSTGWSVDPPQSATVNVNGAITRGSGRTVTCSPRANRRSGVNTPPRSSRSAWTRPVCGPLTEPVTSTPASLAASTPTNVMLVLGEATRHPGPG